MKFEFDTSLFKSHCCILASDSSCDLFWVFSADLNLERSKFTKLLGVKNKVVLNAVKRSSNSRKTREEVPELEYDGIRI